MTENERMTLDEAIVHSKEVAERNRVLANSDVLVQKSYDVKLNTLRCNKCADEHEQLAKWLEELKAYRAIGTIEEFKALKEKSVAKKPTEKELPYSEEVGLNSEWHCPACGSYVGYFTEGMNEPEQMEYCNVCGQHIAKDWIE